MFLFLEEGNGGRVVHVLLAAWAPVEEAGVPQDPWVALMLPEGERVPLEGFLQQHLEHTYEYSCRYKRIRLIQQTLYNFFDINGL